MFVGCVTNGCHLIAPLDTDKAMQSICLENKSAAVYIMGRELWIKNETVSKDWDQGRQNWIFSFLLVKHKGLKGELWP